jgi:hypothetical protein
MRTCEDCGDPVSGRRKRCPDCKRADHARAEKARREAAKSAPSYDSSSTAVGLDMLACDYTIPGSASKPPSFDVHPKTPRPVCQEIITDGRVRSPAERQHRPSLEGIPNAIRRDRVRLEATLARQQIGADEGDSDMASWDELQARNTRQNDRVSFHVPALPPAGTRPARMKHLGQSVPRSGRGWS